MSDQERRRLARLARHGQDKEAQARLQRERERAGEKRRLPLPEWADPDKSLVVSSSQLDSWTLCKRKWWFEKAIKLPTPDQKHLIFGTALHSVLERWLDADHLGRDKATGQPVNLYPKGWDEGLSPAQADLIQKLVAAGIERGIVTRHQHQVVEHPFLRHLDRVGDWDIFITGFIDLLLRDAIEDHKTSKSTRWLKSENKLADDGQVQRYAGELLRLADEAGVHLETVRVAHNQFVKDPAKPIVRKTQAYLDRATIEARWVEDQRLAREMLEAKQRFTRPEDHHLLPDPPTNQSACRAFGGCPFQGICGGRETPQEYSQRMTLLNNSEPSMSGSIFSQLNGSVPPSPPSTINYDEQRFWYADNGQPLEALGRDVPKDAPDRPCMLTTDKEWKTVADFFPPQAAAPAVPSAPAVPAAPAPVTTPATPWYHEGCTACSQNPVRGLAPNGEPCRICDSMQAQAGKTTSASYDLSTAGDGTVTWSPKASAPAATPPAATAPLPEASAAPQESKPKKKRTRKSKKTEDADEDKPSALDLEIERGRGRPPKTFQLLIGCYPIGKQTLDLAEILEKLGALLAQQMNAASYYDLDPFKRRDALANAVPKILDDLSGKWIVANGDSPDQKALRDALRGHASLVIEGCR